VLQLSSFQERSEAEAFLAQVKEAGFSPFITEGTVNGTKFYRVRMGSYRSMEAANDAKSEIEKTLKKSASVMKL
jgi:cell division protein FtsN